MYHQKVHFETLKFYADYEFRIKNQKNNGYQSKLIIFSIKLTNNFRFFRHQNKSKFSFGK